MIRHLKEIHTKLSIEGCNEFEFVSSHRGLFTYSDNKYSIIFKPELRDRISLIMVLQDLVQMGELRVYDNKDSSLVYNCFYEEMV